MKNIDKRNLIVKTIWLFIILYSSKIKRKKNFYSLLRYCTALKLNYVFFNVKNCYSLLRYCTALKLSIV